MNTYKNSRSNKAKNDKGSILADAKNLFYILVPAVQRVPKIERMEGAPAEMKRATMSLIRHFSIAKECPEVRSEHIRAMFGDFGVLLAAFDLCIVAGFFTNGERARIAIQLERIEEGVRKWRNATRSSDRQDRAQVGGHVPQESHGSNELM